MKALSRHKKIKKRGWGEGGSIKFKSIMSDSPPSTWFFFWVGKANKQKTTKGLEKEGVSDIQALLWKAKEQLMITQIKEYIFMHIMLYKACKFNS